VDARGEVRENSRQEGWIQERRWCGRSRLVAAADGGGAAGGRAGTVDGVAPRVALPVLRLDCTTATSRRRFRLPTVKAWGRWRGGGGAGGGEVGQVWKRRPLPKHMHVLDGPELGWSERPGRSLHISTTSKFSVYSTSKEDQMILS